MIVHTAALASETATCWVLEPRHASAVLERLRTATNATGPHHTN